MEVAELSSNASTNDSLIVFFDLDARELKKKAAEVDIRGS